MCVMSKPKAKLLLEIKEINIKTLVSGDQQGKIVLYTTSPDQIEILKQLAGNTFINVEFANDSEKETKQSPTQTE